VVAQFHLCVCCNHNAVVQSVQTVVSTHTFNIVRYIFNEWIESRLIDDGWAGDTKHWFFVSTRALRVAVGIFLRLSLAGVLAKKWDRSAQRHYRDVLPTLYQEARKNKEVIGLLRGKLLDERGGLIFLNNAWCTLPCILQYCTVVVYVQDLKSPALCFIQNE
jgi:hypothetical protein